MSSSSELLLSLALSTASRVGLSTSVPIPSRAGGVAPSAVATALVLKAAGTGFSSAVGGSGVDSLPEDVSSGGGGGGGSRRRSRAVIGGGGALTTGQGVETIFTGGARDGAGVGRPVVLPSVRAITSAAAVAATTAAAAAESAPPKSRGWFELAVPEMTTEVRRELAIVRNRTFLDPKRHYKTAKEDRNIPKTFAIGTYVMGAGERAAPREARGARAPTLVDTLLGDGGFKSYAGRTMRTVRERAEGGGIVAYQAKKAQAGADWKKRRADYQTAHGKKVKKPKLY
jgi:Fcf2 pre-rRNA processing